MSRTNHHGRNETREYVTAKPKAKQRPTRAYGQYLAHILDTDFDDTGPTYVQQNGTIAVCWAYRRPIA